MKLEKAICSIESMRERACLEFVLKVTARTQEALSKQKEPADVRCEVARRILGCIPAYAFGAPARMRSVRAYQKRATKSLDKWLLSRKRGQVHLIRK